MTYLRKTSESFEWNHLYKMSYVLIIFVSMFVCIWFFTVIEANSDFFCYGKFNLGLDCIIKCEAFYWMNVIHLLAQITKSHPWIIFYVNYSFLIYSVIKILKTSQCRHMVIWGTFQFPVLSFQVIRLCILLVSTMQLIFEKVMIKKSLILYVWAKYSSSNSNSFLLNRTGDLMFIQ